MSSTTVENLTDLKTKHRIIVVTNLQYYVGNDEKTKRKTNILIYLLLY